MSDVHVYPVNDLREHEISRDCPCNPREDEDEPSVVIHNAWDKRALRERREEMQ
jgi:hypothetical protein